MYTITYVDFYVDSTVAASQVQQILDGEQKAASVAGEERDEGLLGCERKRGLVVLHNAILQAA